MISRGPLEVIREALQASENPHTLFDGARYWARNSVPDEAVRLLARGIELKPTIIVEMMSETDFDGISDHLRLLTTSLVTEVREKVRGLLDEWGATIGRWERMQEAGGFSVGEPRELSRAHGDELAGEVETADYLRCLAMIEEAHAALEQLPEHAVREREREVEARRGKQNETASRIDSAAREAESRRMAIRSDAKRRQEASSLGLGLMAVICSGVGIVVGFGVAEVVNDTFGAVVGVTIAIGPPCSSPVRL